LYGKHEIFPDSIYIVIPAKAGIHAFLDSQSSWE
jgi:hypothetical protein